MSEIRLNVHQQHWEDLVWLEPSTLQEAIQKMEDFVSDVETSTNNLHITRKIDGSPAVMCWHHVDGMPDDSISLKGGFLGKGTKCYSSDDEIQAVYDGDMAGRMHYALMLAPYIPDGEAWQGDVLFTQETLKHENINGQNYISFKPNTVDYAVSEDSPTGKKIAEAEYGISFHTKWTGSLGNFKQSFRLDVSTAKFPDWAFVLSPCLDWKSADIDLDSLKAAIATFKEKAEDLLAKPEFEAAVTNPVVKEFWARFTNNNLSDKEAIKYNEAKFVDELIAFCEEAIEGDYRKADVKTADLKTDKGRMTKRNKLYDKSLEDLQSSLDFIDQNEDILKEIVSATNACVDVKMQIVDALDKLDPGYKTFYLDQEQNYIPANGEGYAMSDTDGNVVKLVNRATFSHANRTFGPAVLRKQAKNESTKAKRTLLERMRAYHNYAVLKEADEKTVVCAYGRMNPPTIGHKKLVQTMADAARENNAKSILFLSNSHDQKKNPLTPEQKRYWAGKAFGGMVDDIICDERSKLFFGALHYLTKEGYKNLIYCCGDDEYEKFKPYLKQYNGKEDPSDPRAFKFDSIKVVNVGAREGDEVESASASKARQFAAEGDFASFTNIIAVDKDEAKELYKDVRIGMGIGEIEENANPFCNFFRKSLNEKTTAHDYYYDIVKAINPNFDRYELADNSKGSERKNYIELRCKTISPTDDTVSPEEFRQMVFALDTKGKEIDVNGAKVSIKVEDANFKKYGTDPLELSNTFESIRTVFTIDGMQHEVYFTDNSKAIKMFTPNKVLASCLDNWCTVDQILKALGNDTDKAYLADIVRSATNAQYIGNIDTVKAFIKNPITAQTPENGTFSFNAGELLSKYTALSKPAIANGIYVDFAEVFGAVAFASLLGNDSKIYFPKASNQPIIDWSVQFGDESGTFKVSAKTDGGGKATSTGMVEYIAESAKDTTNTLLINTMNSSPKGSALEDFLTSAFQHEVAGKTTHGSFVRMAQAAAYKICEEKTELSQNETDDMDVLALDFSFASGCAAELSAYIGQYGLAGVAEEADNHTIDISEDRDILDMIKSLMEAQGINYDNKFESETVAYCKNAVISYLSKAFVKALNASEDTIDQFNNIFTACFGVFGQFYLNGKDRDFKDFTFTAKYIKNDTVNAQHKYMFVNDCAMEKGTGYMAIKSLATKLS